MDDTDKKILNFIQKEFPVEEEPFQRIAAHVGISADEALARIIKLKEEGIIRRIGAVFDSKKLGFASTLCAAKVPESEVDGFVAVVNAYPGVTHNYRRNHAYNIWFTFIAPSQEALDHALEEIKSKTGISDILSMSAVRTFKIDARFPL